MRALCNRNNVPSQFGHHLAEEMSTEVLDRVTIVDAQSGNSFPVPAHWDRIQLGKIINRLGEESSEAQKLKNILTKVSKIDQNTHLFLMCREWPSNKPADDLIGLAKVAVKPLWFVNKQPTMKNMYVRHETLSLLDFYIQPEHQRKGHGLTLLNCVFKNLAKWCVKDLASSFDPSHMAYELPSNYLYSFLAKHFSLREPKMQPNTFVIYDGFFEGQQGIETKAFNKHHRAAGSQNRQQQHQENMQKSQEENTKAPLLKKNDIVQSKAAKISKSERVQSKAGGKTPPVEAVPRKQPVQKPAAWQCSQSRPNRQFGCSKTQQQQQPQQKNSNARPNNKTNVRSIKTPKGFGRRNCGAEQTIKSQKDSGGQRDSFYNIFGIVKAA